MHELLSILKVDNFKFLPNKLEVDGNTYMRKIYIKERFRISGWLEMG